MSALAHRPLLLVDGAGALSPHDLGILSAAGLARPERVDSLDAAAALLRDRPGSVILLPVHGPDPALDAFGHTLRAHPDAVAIAVAPERNTESVLTAMRAGIDEFLVTPLHAQELRSALERLRSRPSTGAPMGGTRHGQVYAVHAAKGGLGTSTIAASLAAVLADPAPCGHDRPRPRRVVLVDFSSAGAGLRIMLNVDPTNDLSQLQQRTEAIDAPFVQSLLVDHQGVALLAAGVSEVSDGLDSVTASQLIAQLRQLFDVVIIDTDRMLTEQTLAALDAADRILVVGQPEILALRSVQQALAAYRRLGYADETVHVVLNRTTDRDRLSPADVRRVLGRSVAVQVPNAYRECHAAIAAGAFIPRHAPTSPLTTAHRTLATVLTGESERTGSAQRRHGWGRLFRRYDTT